LKCLCGGLPLEMMLVWCRSIFFRVEARAVK
jgi:hypothetical protein